MDDAMIRMMQLGGKGYSCSQILVRLALELREEENPSLVRAMAGPAYGCGSGSGTCGALTGGCCILALYGGKGSDEEEASDLLPLMLSDLSDWFSETVGQTRGGIDCRSIAGEDGPAGAQAVCGGIVADTWNKALAILLENGFDLV